MVAIAIESVCTCSSSGERSGAVPPAEADATLMPVGLVLMSATPPF